MYRSPWPRRCEAVAWTVAVLITGAPRVGRGDESAPTTNDVAPIEVRVRASPRASDPERVTISMEEARRVPGGQGDALKVVESLPGVGRSSFDSGKLVLWGGAPEDSRVYVDGVEIPALFHGSGLRGTVNDALIQSVEVAKGAYGADYGRALGGMVRLKTRDLPDQGVHGYVGADLLDASAMLTAALGSSVRVAVGGRASYLDRILAGIVSPGVGDYFPIPRYGDYQAKVSLALREDETLDLVVLGSSDALDRVIESPSPARVRREVTSDTFQRVYLRYSRTLTNGETVTVTPFVGHDQNSVDDAFGGTPARFDQSAWRGGVRASFRRHFEGGVTATVGLDAQASMSTLFRAGSMTIPAREGDLRVLGQPPGPDVNVDHWAGNVTDLAPYLITEWRLGPVSVIPALRVDAFLIEGSRLTPPAGTALPIGFSRLPAAVDPRISVSVPVTSRISVSAAGGIYHQPPDPADMSAVFGTPALTLQRAIHTRVSAAARLGDGFTADTTAYYESLDHLVVRSRLSTPTLAQAFTQDGEGQSYGVEAKVRKSLGNGFMGWVAYTASQSERRHVRDLSYRLFDYDRTSVLSVVGSYEHRGWSFGIRFRYTTGAPRTPVVGSFVETTSGRFEPVLGTQNSVRLPDFYQLDLRLEKRITLAKVNLAVSLDVLNLTYRKNAEELVYSNDYSKKTFVTGLPTLGVLGVRIEL